MAVPHDSGAFGDLLDPLFQKIFRDQYDQLPDMVGQVYTMEGTNGRETIKWSGVGALGDFVQFNGTVSYDSFAQAYDVTATPLQFTSGVQVTRQLFDDDQWQIMNQRPRGLAMSANRTRQKHAARYFNNAFSVDTLFYSHSEGVALVSDSHTTNSPSADTSSGFDNLVTSALSATAVASARIQMVGFVDDRGNKISVMPDTIWIPNALYEEAFEIVQSRGKVDTAENNANVHNGQYTIKEWNYLSDTNNWFMTDEGLRKQGAYWTDRVPLEFAYVEDFDTLVAKWRAYMRYASAHVDWRGILGAQVS